MWQLTSLFALHITPIEAFFNGFKNVNLHDNSQKETSWIAQTAISSCIAQNIQHLDRVVSRHKVSKMSVPELITLKFGHKCQEAIAAASSMSSLH